MLYSNLALKLGFYFLLQLRGGMGEGARLLAATSTTTRARGGGAGATGIDEVEVFGVEEGVPALFCT